MVLIIATKDAESFLVFTLLSIYLTPFAFNKIVTRARIPQALNEKEEGKI